MLLVDVIGNVGEIRRDVFVDYEASIDLADHETYRWLSVATRIPTGTR